MCDATIAGPAAPVPPVLPPLGAGPAGGPVVSPHAPPLVPGDGTFRVDLARAPEVIKELQTALDDLNEIRGRAMKLGKVNPGSHDSVSIDAAAALGAVATGGPGSFLVAVEAGIEQIQGLIDTLTAELHDYRATESGAARNLGDTNRA